ncbi:MAG: tetratricopeptide repeat protein [Bacteroidota bacterium]
MAESSVPLWKRWNNYGIGLLGEEDFQQALRAFEEVAKLRPDLPDGKLNIGRTYLAEGNLRKAKEKFEEVIQLFPDHQTTIYFQGQVALAQGNHELALALWQQVEDDFPYDIRLLSDMGELFYLTGAYDQAESYLARALNIDPEHSPTLYRRMLLAGAQNQPEQVIFWQEKYLYHKENEAEQTIIAAFKKRHPEHQLETQPVHFHRLRRAE